MPLGQRGQNIYLVFPTLFIAAVVEIALAEQVLGASAAAEIVEQPHHRASQSPCQRDTSVSARHSQRPSADPVDSIAVPGKGRERSLV